MAKIKRKQIAIILVGSIIALLGLLWFLQGAGIIQMCPILCIADCECLTGGSQFWAIVGAVVFLIGAAVVGVSAWRIKTEAAG